MTNAKKAEEFAFNKRYSRFKLQMFFHQRNPITFYAQELYGFSVSQIKFGHVKQLTLDRERGLQSCYDRITLCEKLYGRYTTALIYDKTKKTILPDGTELYGKEVLKFINGIAVESDTEILAVIDRKILCDVIHEKGMWKLQRVVPKQNAAAIDFKKEVAKALLITEPKS